MCVLLAIATVRHSVARGSTIVPDTKAAITAVVDKPDVVRLQRALTIVTSIVIIVGVMMVVVVVVVRQCWS